MAHVYKPNPDPGRLPTKPPPKPGERLAIRVHGLPPYKSTGRSLRNVRHPNYDAFLQLREAAAQAMDGKCWYEGPIAMSITLYLYSPTGDGPPGNVYSTLPGMSRSWLAYYGGVMDTLDGSHGPTFTYLPIVYQDDGQIIQFDGGAVYQSDHDTYYETCIEFLAGNTDSATIKTPYRIT